MSVNSSGVPLFAGTDAGAADDAFMATMEELDKTVQDQITVAHPFYAYLESKKLIEYRSSIADYVPVKLMDKENSTVKDFSHYDLVDNTPQSGVLSEAKFAYGHTVGTQMYSREELIKNSGKEQLIDMARVKTEQLTTSMKNFFGTKIMGAQDADGRSIMGLGRVMAFDQICGAIDPTVAGFEYWNPQQGLKSDGVTQWSLATEMRPGQRAITRDLTYVGLSNPDVEVCGEDLYDAMQAYAEDKVRLSLDELRDERGWGGFDMFPFNGKTYIYDPAMDAKTGWLLNTTTGIKLRVHSGTNFQFEDWQMMESKIAKKRDCLLYASLYVKRRNANGFITYL